MSTEQPYPSDADRAACELIPPMLAKIDAGMSVAEAVKTIGVGASAGRLSVPIRGMFNTFRTAAAVEGDYLAGVATKEQATEAFQAAVDGFYVLWPLRPEDV